jgi:CubicO group peptidase (beta-lactamase class C family)
MRSAKTSSRACASCSIITTPTAPSTDVIAQARAVVSGAIASGVFPAAVAEVGDRKGRLWSEAFGTLTADEDAPRATEATLFDLASLTKPIATTTLILGLLADRRIDLHAAVGAAFPEWRGEDRATATIQDLLEHSSGLPARLLDAPPTTRREFEHEICHSPLEYPPHTKSIYSDLDFILLGFLIEDRGGSSLANQFAATVDGLVRSGSLASTARTLTFGVDEASRANVAATMPLAEDHRRGRQLRGEVHDSYGAALGGVAGHTGLFGSASAVGAFARGVLSAALGDEGMPIPLSPRLVARATRKTEVPGSSRALGWDTMLPTSSCGTELSPAAFGHVGFTGTSLWIDPILDRYFVLLTNRAGGSGTSEQMQRVRRAFHDAAARI